MFFSKSLSEYQVFSQGRFSRREPSLSDIRIGSKNTPPNSPSNPKGSSRPASWAGPQFSAPCLLHRSNRPRWDVSRTGYAPWDHKNSLPYRPVFSLQASRQRGPDSGEIDGQEAHSLASALFALGKVPRYTGQPEVRSLPLAPWNGPVRDHAGAREGPGT